MKHLRIYLKQPSPQWLDYTLRMCTLYTRRTDYTNSTSPLAYSPSGRAGSAQSNEKGGTNAFDAFKSKLGQNLKKMKKSTKH